MANKISAVKKGMTALWFMFAAVAAAIFAVVCVLPLPVLFAAAAVLPLFLAVRRFTDILLFTQKRE